MTARHLGMTALVVRDYDAAIQFYVDILGFHLLEDTRLSETKRWVVVAPDPARGAALLLARAASPEQLSRVGDQTGGRVFLFLYTDDHDRDRAAWTAAGVRFVRGPHDESWGRVSVFEDLHGTLWDLIQPVDAP